jgi:lipoprotein NlpD
MNAWLRQRALATAALLLAGCTTVPVRDVPIVEKSERRGAPAAAATAAPAAAATLPAAREAKDGQYVVQRGDTLYSIALAFGQDYRDLARWNGLDDPSKLRVGQTLRVEPTAGDASLSAAVTTAPVAPVAAAEVRPLEAPRPLPPVAPAAAGAAATAPSATAAAPAVTTGAAVAATAAPRGAATEPALSWAWPAAGAVIEPFNDTRNKGVDIGGKEGDAVLAANEGTVVYSGSGLRGYGNLVIIKHTDDFISAYAHNRQILVKQGQAVKRGQRIADLGRTDAEIPKLHFEIRRQGKPVDPLRYLPAR